ncbi:MAG TPA: MarR family transcriptional regulator [Fimbriimonas sp.]|nr:MarR family transcriptional regulator [Fimbriimonas sp.]
MDSQIDRAARIECLLPRLMRLIYRSTEDTMLVQLPLAQIRIVRLLYAGSRTVTSLGEELGLTASAVTQMANRLQDAGLVARVEDSEDRRVKHLALTEKAQELMKARQDRRVGRMNAVLDHISKERQVAIVEALEDMLQAGGELPFTEPLSFVAEVEQAVPLASPPHQ